ncbi:type II toxin-antitoxin system HicA family toxin [Candidatus Ruthia endofausta]|uniref:type II toxin-antitoxin system HicA family toxin n=1 Tax=Candidatus Ruthia endofausta TaxID=2738852 RepID=UPI001FE78BE3|nr:type II toxin-antitoxin system HicA family toxin [Candidatus Ruthia endofausta]
MQQLQNKPKNINFDLLKKLLLQNGYECINSSDSHFVFRKDNAPSITIPFKRPIKVIYVKKVLAILENEK